MLLVDLCRKLQFIINKFPDQFIITHKDEETCSIDLISMDMLKKFSMEGYLQRHVGGQEIPARELEIKNFSTIESTRRSFYAAMSISPGRAFKYAKQAGTSISALGESDNPDIDIEFPIPSNFDDLKTLINLIYETKIFSPDNFNDKLIVHLRLPESDIAFHIHLTLSIEKFERFMEILSSYYKFI